MDSRWPEPFPATETLDLGESCYLKIYKNKENKNQKKSKTVILTIPGGGYEFVADREGYPIVSKFLSFGYSSALLVYKVGYGCYPTNYNQGLKSIEHLSKQFKNIILIGFSAGGHFAGFLGTSERTKIPSVIGMILCYPVITFGEKAHIGSAKHFLGDKFKDDQQRKNYSIENRVNENTVPTFIWCTKDDELVPYENTLLMVEKLKKYGIKHVVKIFESGIHGLSLADESTIENNNKKYVNKEVQQWVKIADEFVESLIA